MAKKAAGAGRRATETANSQKTARSTKSIAPRPVREAAGKQQARRVRARKPSAPEPGTAHKEAAAGSLQATAAAIGRTIGRTTAAIGQHLPWKGANDGLTLLERDHRVLESLLKQAVETDEHAPADRSAALARLAQQLSTHELMEEKVLYPALKSHAEAKDIVLEGYQEHHVADLVMNELREMPPTDERWGAKLKVLKENIEHHIEEEEGEMFKTARSILSDEQLEALGSQMQELKARAVTTTKKG